MMMMMMINALLHDTTTTRRRESLGARLRKDERGAVMLTGLFMSCFLIGSLWFIVGIGDAIVFRDKMQEAVDHGSFSSAALHARGMNFIALCNLILLVMVVIHMILGIVHDVTLVACIVTVGLACPEWVAARKAYTTYFSMMKKAAKGIHQAEVAATRTYPAIAAGDALRVGKMYGGGKNTSAVTVLAMSDSITGAGEGGKPFSLPVEAKPMSYLCTKALSVGSRQLLSGAFGMSESTFSGAAMGWVRSLVGNALEMRYCNSGGISGFFIKLAVDLTIKKGERSSAGQGKPGDRPVNGAGGAGSNAGNANAGNAKTPKGGGGGGGPDPGFDSLWGEDGPMVVIKEAENGKSAFQIRGTNMSPKLTDTSESRVGISRGPQRGSEKYTKTVSSSYFAQAEYYFDCESTWSDVTCNKEDNATFAIKWRARLRQMEGLSH